MKMPVSKTGAGCRTPCVTFVALMNRRRTQTAFADARQRSTRAIPRGLKLARGVGHAAPVSLGTTYDVVLFDLTSTYFEIDGTKALESDLQRYGYSRDKRGDCLQVVVALVLTPRQVIGKFRAVKMVDVVMPTTDGRIVTLSRYVEPKPDLSVLLDRLGLTLPAQSPPKISSEVADAAKSTV